MSPVPRIVLVGENRPAERLLKALAQRGLLAGLHTDVARQPQLVSLAERSGVPVAEAGPLRYHAETLIAADWLFSVNSATLLSDAVINAVGGRALNLHNGPLPAYAGRHVTQWGIRNGETSFAATIHFMELGVDTGDVVAEAPFEIRADDTGLSVFNRSFKVGVDAMVGLLDAIVEGCALPRRRQDLNKRVLYRHSEALDGRIDWRWTRRKIVDFIRAGNYQPFRSPSFTATIALSDGPVEVFRAIPAAGAGAPGAIREITADGAIVGCADGAVSLTDARRNGERLDAAGWLAVTEATGNRLP